MPLVVALLALLFAAPAASAAVLLDDGFESGTFSAWTSVQTGGDGVGLVQSAVVRTGSGAARLSATTNSGSFARIRKTLSPASTTLVAEGDFRVLAEGAANGNVPIFRLFDTAGARTLSLFRQNLTGGKLSVNHAGGFFATAGVLPQDAWRRVALRVVVNGDFSTVQVSVDGASVYSAAAANLGTNAIGALQVGNEVSAQRFDLVVDDVRLSDDAADPPPPPAPPPPPPDDTTPPETTIDAGPAGSVSTTTATFAFSSSESGSSFECRLDFGTWSDCSSPRALPGLAVGSHTFQVRATDPAQNTDPSPAERTWTVAMPDGRCDPSVPAPTTTDPGAVAVADGFEDGLGQWTETVQEGDATAAVQGDTVKRGACALRLNVTNDVWSSRAHLAKVMPARTKEIWADGWFNTLQDGADTNWNTPTFRFLSMGKRVLDVSRQNGNGQLFIRYPNPAGGWSFGYGNRLLALNRWYRIKVHVVADGNLSTVEVWLDGTRVYRNTGATLGASELDVTLVGAEHQNQEGVVAADDVVIKALQAPPTSEVFGDGFESGNLAGWTTSQASGGGTVAVEPGAASEGAFGAKLTTTASTSSLANVRRTLSAAQTDLTTSADVKVLSEGAAGGDTPLLAVNDAGGVRLVTVVRNNQSGDRLAVQHGGTTHPTTGTLPLGAWGALELRTITFGAGAGTVALSLNGTEIYRSTTASIGSTGVKSLLLGATSAGKGFSFAADRVAASKGTSGPANDPRYKLLIADYLNRRLLITDFEGNVVWRMDNPTGGSSSAAGPIGVRWQPGNQILATFGTGEVVVIDVATKKWVWQTRGYNGEIFESPYDAELLPDGRLAVALRFNSKGRVSVYDRSTGAEVWRHLVPEAHSVGFRTAAQSYNSPNPTILIGGFGNIKEVTYDPGGSQAVTWSVRSEFTHDVMVVENDRLITTEGYYIQKIDRSGTRVWRRNTPDENRRVTSNPNFGGGYVFTVGEGDRIEFRDANGDLLREFSRLSDDTVLDYPYGIEVIEYPGH